MARRQDVNSKATGHGPVQLSRSTSRGYVCAQRWELNRLAFAVLALLVVISSGCTALRLPAIDPTGNCIFLPKGNSTQLTLPRLHGNDQTAGIFPSPAYREPPPPPACLEGPSIAPTVKPAGLRSHSAASDRGRCGELLLTPTRIVAPVNGDVVLLSGICGQDGLLVAGETIEWMISPDSVGQIIEVGDDGSSASNGLFHRTESKVKKLGVDYAHGITAFDDQVVTRGSGKLADELPVRKGQTWISLSSPTEGITRITALAPDAEVWDKRRQTATIYWVDARWQFPNPITIPGTSPAELVTRVTRSEGFAPADGWIVRYRSLNPEVALFAPTNSDVADVRVDSDGKAAVTLNNISGRSGTALIAMEVIRPAQNSENIPELPLGRGQAIVSWSMPELVLDAAGPALGGVGETLTYNATLSNIGSLPADNARITMVIPSGMQLVGTTQTPTQSSPTALAWDIGQLPAARRFDVSVQLRAQADSDYRVRFDASGLPNGKEVSTLVTSPKLSLLFQPARGFEQVEVGQQVPMELVVTNDGRTSMGNIEITIESSPALQHARENASVVRQTVTNLRPGESRTLNPTYIARQVGNLQATAIASSNSVELARQTTAVQVVEATRREPRISLDLQKSDATDLVTVGQVFSTRAVVTNSGQVLLQNVQVEVTYSASLLPKMASEGAQDLAQQRRLIWIIPSLDIGQTLGLVTQFDYNGSEATPLVTASAQTSPQVRASAVLNLRNAAGGGSEVMPPSDVQPPTQVLPPGASQGSVLPPQQVLPGNGANLAPWQLIIEPVRSQVRTGAVARYSVAFRNNRTSPDQGAALRIRIPVGTRLQAISTPDGRQVSFNVSADGTEISFERVSFVAPNETLKYTVDLVHPIPGTATIQALLTSNLDTQGVQASAIVDVVN